MNLFLDLTFRGPYGSPRNVSRLKGKEYNSNLVKYHSESLKFAYYLTI